ncbi:MotA/TolQ/ExbB proton channel family protein [Pseudoalteromonas sp. NEC-BIFX-2020_015]|uniref:MotA/TolQ/ExbB proton channel family protein n=1 Tax=Pseudoalteromonas sp. NEC-BIFX-2020_015 TaxID=2729544 RepID=UPI00146162BF|nr:MotA/TolQ/ExbB proton channel family protein [Pseudoalteromonas sp. NEC-BIFX-2020_015]NMR25391.1 MotA/TolQ/ExbB proton channel family protein [Pseudoalteromonas sp. NEC-BIFX-2020_015]
MIKLILRVFGAATLLFSVLVFNQALASSNDVLVSLQDDIKKSQQALSKTQNSIAKQRSALAKSFNKVEQKVLALRETTAVARRLNDEKTMGFEKLKQRLDDWQQQHSYQQNVLQRYIQQNKLTGVNNASSQLLVLDSISVSINALAARSTPTWGATNVAFNDGSLKPVDSLSIGPVNWFLDTTTQQSGLYSRDNDMNKVALIFESAQYEQLTELKSSRRGEVMFDPTLSRALKIQHAKESMTDHIAKGGIWVTPILAFGVFALLISFAKALQLWRLPKVLPAMAERLRHVYELSFAEQRSALEKLTAQNKGMQAQLVEISIATDVGPQRDDQLFSALLNHKHTLEYWLGAVAITAAVSPLLGLLGTVSGMIETFKLMTLFGAGDPAAVSGGISEALVTTELGLVVAIPALLLHALLSRKVKTYYGELESCAVNLSQISNSTAALNKGE